ncbi:MAG: TolC family protein, partial [Bradyrhizobium sp.]
MTGNVSARTSRGPNKLTLAISALLLGPALSGCILGTERPDLNLDTPATYREGGHTAPDAHLPAVDWWRGFKSSELTSLMDAAQIYNLDIAVAIAQIAQADAQVGVQGAPLLPSVTGTGNAEQSRNSTGSFATGGGIGGTTFQQYSLGLTASY